MMPGRTAPTTTGKGPSEGTGSTWRNSRARERAGSKNSRSLSASTTQSCSLQEDVPGPRISPLVPSSLPVATICLRNGENLVNLSYFLWGDVGRSRPVEDWPFSKSRLHWLYDEIDVERNPPAIPLYSHRILWSDGRVTSIPFFDVIVESFAAMTPERASVANGTH